MTSVRNVYYTHKMNASNNDDLVDKLVKNIFAHSDKFNKHQAKELLYLCRHSTGRSEMKNMEQLAKVVRRFPEEMRNLVLDNKNRDLRDTVEIILESSVDKLASETQFNRQRDEARELFGQIKDKSSSSLKAALKLWKLADELKGKHPDVNHFLALAQIKQPEMIEKIARKKSSAAATASIDKGVREMILHNDVKDLSNAHLTKFMHAKGKVGENAFKELYSRANKDISGQLWHTLSELTEKHNIKVEKERSLMREIQTFVQSSNNPYAHILWHRSQKD